MPGYHLNLYNKKENILTSQNSKNSFNNINHIAYDPNLTASRDRVNLIPAHNQKRTVFDKNTEACDLIILKNGGEIQGKVTEINLQEIKYKKCDNIDGPVISISKKDVFMIKYSNGTKDIINIIDEKSDEKTTPNINKEGLKKTSNTQSDSSLGENKENLKSPWALLFAQIAGYINCLLAIFISAGFISITPIFIMVSVFGLIFTIIANVLYKNNPEKYKKN